MIRINGTTKKRYRHEAREMEELGLSYGELSAIVDAGIKQFEEMETGLQAMCAEAADRPGLNYVLAAPLQGLQDSINYAYFLLCNYMPQEIKDSRELSEQFAENRRSLLLLLKESILRKQQDKRKER